MVAPGRHTADDPREVLARPLAATSLLDAIRDLRRDVEDTDFPLALPSAAGAIESRDRLLHQLTEHLLPRLTELSAPAVVVVAGPTGAGKSTLVNSLLGHQVSDAGVLRPTTRQPVLVHHPDDLDLLADHPLVASSRTVADVGVPRGIALLDAPDMDSVLEANRETAHRLLEAADLWLFVTTAARYGDALPWHVLSEAADRGASVAMVLNRVPTASLPTIRGDLLTRLREHGLEGSPLFVVLDGGPQVELLEASAVASVNRWLLMLAGPDRSRSVIGRTLRGSLAALRVWVDRLAEAVQEQADAAADLLVLLEDATREHTRAAAAAARAADGGTGAVAVRWAELTSGDGVFARLAGRSGGVRGSGRHRQQRQAAVEPVQHEAVRWAQAVIAAGAARARTGLRDALSAPDAPPGAALLLETWQPATGDGADEAAARAWAGQGLRTLRAALADPAGAGGREGRRREKAVRVLGDETLAAIALVGAAGVRDAGALLGALVGPGVATRVVDELREDLVARAAARVEQARAEAGRPLDDADLAPDAASRLRLRLAVIKGLT
ncbi:hypothetical protein CCO02nite_14010 [Cellulomonas composti]|uniref:G domain-containing protein n=1 Tax=Cellulomonas composti TaxID=266130 RepID=A0A511JAK9_9CELL|nr:hypothetical protein CCO02nite_14010 [Cellulomonas composti]